MVVLYVLIALLVLGVLVTANWYLWRRLFRDTTARPGPVRRAGAAVIAGGWVLAVGALVAERAGAPFWLQQVLAWPGFLWLALSIYLLLAVVAGEIVRPLVLRVLARRKQAAADGRQEQPEPEPEAEPVHEPGPGPKSAPVPQPSRRLFVSRVVAGVGAAAAVGTVGYGTYGVLRGPRVKRVTVPLAKLPREAHGYRIAVVSDIHLGPILGRSFTQKVVDTINSTRPDIVAVVGDLVDGSVRDLGPAAAPLTRLEAPSYFVTGNHEYFSGAEQWVEEVRRLGLRPLENARTELPWFDLAGVNDVAGESEGHGPDFGRALGDRDTARACVLLAHQPVQIHDAVRHGVDLQLSGHTHGGQLWPGSLIAEAANPTVAGLERYGDTQLYVSRGAGAWGPPTRVGAPSDITVIELASTRA
ncbi:MULTISPECIES: metallophosphoesterase [Streptomyces]|uniref:Metallophosphoesterase n=1 Tax=Streptomyces spinosisporus TaxID=2927582 RepID=A0ABS9XBY2_9ACTN|nr:MULTISPECIES: metallophosphoesterase [Streptomyces]MCI3239588.1 metallophosphoesterase [Streptomyces spinosisporus]WUB37879.1 metallophosphoesterase [Streptomyces sp. NBC_00588]